MSRVNTHSTAKNDLVAGAVGTPKLEKSLSGLSADFPLKSATEKKTILGELPPLKGFVPGKLQELQPDEAERLSDNTEDDVCCMHLPWLTGSQKVVAY